jgi:hypothetical protein
MLSAYQHSSGKGWPAFSRFCCIGFYLPTAHVNGTWKRIRDCQLILD